MIEYLRFLFRNKWYIIVEVIGISVALAFTIPLLSFFSDKWEIDHGKDFFTFFDVNLSQGSPLSLSDRKSVLISESLAAKIGDDAIGKPLTCAGEEYIVNGIFDDQHNSLLPSADIIFSIDSPMLDAQWANPSGYWEDIVTFIRIQDGFIERIGNHLCRIP